MTAGDSRYAKTASLESSHDRHPAKLMRKGYLNKTELARVGRIYRDLEKLRSEMPTCHSKEEDSTYDLITTARNKLGELLRWQDFGGVWQEVKQLAAQPEKT